MKSELLEHWRISTFRLAILFTLAIIALLGLIYWQTAGYLTQQADIIIHAIARGLASIPHSASPLKNHFDQFVVDDINSQIDCDTLNLIEWVRNGGSIAEPCSE